MKKLQRFLALLAALIVLAAYACASAAAQTNTDGRIIDRADLFTSSEEATISKAIADFQAATGYDFVVLTSNEEHEDKSQLYIADEVYRKGGYGFDEDFSGVLYYIDMYDRQEYLSTTGLMIDIMTGNRTESALDKSNPHLRSADYDGAALAMIAAVQQYAKAGIPEGAFRYDLVTGQRLTASHKALTSSEVLISAVISLVVGLIFIMGVRSRYKLKGSTYHYDYNNNSDMAMTEQTDQYLRTTVTRAPKSPPPSSGGGGFGGGGGGGGSAVHSTGGMSHGGGGRGF